MSRAKILRWMLLSGVGAFIWNAALPPVEPMDDLGAPLLELLGDNEIANPVIDGILEHMVSFAAVVPPGCSLERTGLARLQAQFTKDGIQLGADSASMLRD